ncbi:MAG: RNA polymerase sigma factor [Pirellulales bacterium]
MSEPVADNSLIGAAIAGEIAALEQLLISDFPALESYIDQRIPADVRRHVSAEDVLQDLFVQAFRDIRQCNCCNHVSFFAWLKAIADHRLADAIKRIGRKKRGGDRHQLSRADVATPSTSVTLIDIVCHDIHLPDDSAARREMEMAIQVALASLPENQRVAVRDHYLLNKDVDVIAREMGCTTGAVRGLIDRGKKKLAEAMGRSSQWFSSR